MCNHSNDKLTHLPIFGDLCARVYMCECGAVLDLADCRTNFGERSLDADELQSLVADLVHLKMGELLAEMGVDASRAAKERLGKVIKDMKEEASVRS